MSLFGHLNGNFCDLLVMRIISGRFEFYQWKLTLSGIYCYACNSYLGQCGERVDNSKGTVFRSRCAGPCFARRGEDDGKPLSGCIYAAGLFTSSEYCSDAVTFRSDGDRPLVTPQRRPRITAVVRGRGAVGTGVIFRDGSIRVPTYRMRLGLTVGRYFDSFDRRVDRAYCGRVYFHFTGVGAS